MKMPSKISILKYQYLFIFLTLYIICAVQCYTLPREKRHHGIYADLLPLQEDASNKQAEGCKPTPNCGTAIVNSDPKAKASNIAQKAAQEAKAANDAQLGAAEAAAAQVKTELAERALQSARAAEAALAGKQQIMEQLVEEHHEAEAVVEDVSNSLQNTQANAAAALDAAKDARTEVEKIKQLLQAATTNLAKIENVSSGAEHELAEKTQLLEAAKNRVQHLGKQLEVSRNDFEKTKKAAYKAACAAVEAKQKAQISRRRRCHRRRRE